MLRPDWIKDFVPPPTRIDVRQRAVIVLGVLTGIGLTAILCSQLKSSFDLKWWLMAPLGATAAQVFSVPGSPMSQPWPIIAGHGVSALAGLLALQVFGQTSLAAGVAVGLATALMLFTRSLHPSGGGTALFMVISQTSDPGFVVFPVVVNAAVLVVIAMVFHRVTGHTYPQRQWPAPAHQTALLPHDPKDLEASLEIYNQALSISRQEIDKLIEDTELQAYSRLTSGLICAQIMTTRLRTLTLDTPLAVARTDMETHDIKVMPVIDSDRRVKGLLRLKDAVSANPFLACEEVMLRTYLRASSEDPANQLLALMAKDEQRHILITDPEGRLEGIVSRSDLMRAIFHAG